MRAFMALSNLRSGQDVRASGRQGVKAGSLGESKEGHGLGMAWGGLARYHQDSQSTICVNMLYCVCMYVCMYVCTYVRMYVCMYVRTYVRRQACMHACMHVSMYVCMHVCMYACMHACM